MSINKVILIGFVGKDPELKRLDSGSAVANFSLATTERGYTAANGTQVPDRTEWHNVVFWGGLVEVIDKYVKKGSKLYIEGKIKTRSYDAQDGSKRYVTEIWGEKLEMLNGGNREQNQQATGQCNAAPQVSSSSPEPSGDLPF